MANATGPRWKDTKVFFMMGGPCSGKATQCGNLVEKYGLTHLSSGELLRSEVALGTGGGWRLSRLVSVGELVPLDDVMSLMKKAMRVRAPNSPGFIIDGFPRDAEQAKIFESELAPCEAVIVLDVPEDLMKYRMLRRARQTDTEEIFVAKLNLYKEHTRPVIHSYNKRGLVIKVNGVGSIMDVFQRIQAALTNFRGPPAFRRKSRTSSLGSSLVKSGKRSSTEPVSQPGSTAVQQDDGQGKTQKAKPAAAAPAAAPADAPAAAAAHAVATKDSNSIRAQKFRGTKLGK